MTVAMSLLALLEKEPSFGLKLKTEFERRTCGIWPINVGQIYTTLQRLARDGLVRRIPPTEVPRQKTYGMTEKGGACLKSWFNEPTVKSIPSRDELVMKIGFASMRADVNLHHVIQAERRATVQLLQVYVHRKDAWREGADADSMHLLDWLILHAEAQLHWLDEWESRHLLGDKNSTGDDSVPNSIHGS